MDSNLVSILGTLAGLVGGGAIALLFYYLGVVDSRVGMWRSQMFTAIFRLKQMTPTCRGRVPGGFGIYETENYLTCLSEVVCMSGWPEGADALAAIVADMEKLEDYPNPDGARQAEREAKKKEWEKMLHKHAMELRSWHHILPASFVDLIQSQF